MFNPELQSYITSSRASGIGDAEIKSNLLANGWHEADVNAALNGQAVPSPDGQKELTSSGIRFLNYFLDSLFVNVATFILVLTLMLSVPKEVAQTISPFAALLGIAAFLFYYLFFEGVWQRTLGKFITGTKVVMPDGSKPNFSHILGRTFSRIIPFEALSFLFGPRGWHDRLSNTMVVPKAYTPADMSQIRLDQKSKTSTWVIVIVAGIFLIAVIGIISSVVLVSLNSARNKSRDALRVTQARQISTALELYFSDNAKYPTQLQELTTGGYLDEVPVAATPPDGDCTEANNRYVYISNVTSYTLSFCLGEQSGTYDKGVNTIRSSARSTLLQ